MIFRIIPHTGLAASIELNMDRNMVHGLLGQPASSSEAAILTIDDTSLPTPARDGYFDDALQVSYDQDDKVEFIELSGKNPADLQVLFHDIDVFATPARELIEKIRNGLHLDYDRSDDTIPYSFIFREIDLSFWRPVLPEQDEDNEEIPEEDEGKYFWTVGLGRKGYYDEII